MTDINNLNYINRDWFTRHAVGTGTGAVYNVSNFIGSNPIQAAIDQAQADGGGKVIVPAGTYNITSSVTVPVAGEAGIYIGGSNIELEFGPNVTITAGVPVTAILIIGEPGGTTRNVYVHGGATFDGQQSVASAVRVWGSCQQITLEGLTCKEAQTPLLIQPESAGRHEGIRVLECVVENPTTYAAGTDLLIVGRTEKLLISGCRIGPNETTAAGADNLELFDVDSFVIDGNYIVDPGGSQSAIEIYANEDPGLGCHGGIISNNLVYCSRDTDLAYEGITLNHNGANGSELINITVTGNAVWGNFGVGIAISDKADIRGVAIVGNTIGPLNKTTLTNCTGIVVSCPNTVELTGNTVTSPNGTGISVASSRVGQTISNNTIIGGPTAGISLGTGALPDTASGDRHMIFGNTFSNRELPAAETMAYCVSGQKAAYIYNNNAAPALFDGGGNFDRFFSDSNPVSAGPIYWKDNVALLGPSNGQASITSGTTTELVVHEWGRMTTDGTPAGATGGNNFGVPPQVQITPLTSLGAASSYWVESVGSTNFTIVLDVDPGQTVTFAWSVSY